MNLTITRIYSFSAAHHLIGMRDRHKCSRQHGHNYVVELTVTGPLENGLILDAADLDIIVRPVLTRLDHNDLNELAKGEGPISILAQPSIENIASYLWTALGFLRIGTVKLRKLRVRETERLWAEITE